MKRVRTTVILYVTTLVLGALAGDPSAVGERKNLEHDNIFDISVTTTSSAESAERPSRLRTYQPINQPSARDDSGSIDSLSFDIALTGAANNQQVDTTLLISTPSKDSCETPSSHSELWPVWKIDNKVREFRVKINRNSAKALDTPALFLCVYNEYLGQLQHLGERSALRLVDSSHRIGRRNAIDESKHLRVYGFRIETAEKEPDWDDGVPVLRTDTRVVLRLFGSSFGVHGVTKIGFTQEKRERGERCQMMVDNGYIVNATSINIATVEIRIPKHAYNMYMCARDDENNEFIHQGSDSYLMLMSYEPLLPLWAQIGIIGICLCFSALFSGLNLGLMSLDRTDLKILCNTGTESEKRYANAIKPVRDHGNFLLCSILLGNVLVNSTFTILLDSLTSGLIAIVCSTLLIVIFGEITPQALCSRHGLAVGAKTIVITKAVMFLTAPLSYPTSKILDRILGEEIGTYYNRERLNELVKVTKDHNDLDKDEVNIISGVLEMRKKTVGDVMTPIEDAYMLPIESIMDFETISKIMDSGYSRIPVYEEDDRKNISSVLYIKDLAFVDPEENTPLKVLCEYYQNPCHFVFDDMKLDVMFKQFKEGNRGHMAFVHRVNNDGDGDPFYEVIGLVTLEDVIEELIQAEIMDETDRITDNRTKNRRAGRQKQDFSYFVDRRPDTQKIRISPQMTLATFQFLSTTLEPFKRDSISETILRRLLNQDIFRHAKSKSKDKNDPTNFIFNQGKAVDFFVLILEGRVEVTVGKESLVYEGGPFTHFGLQALAPTVGIESPAQQFGSSQGVRGSLQSLNMENMLRHTFVPDYSVKAISDVVYLTIKRSLYLAAKRATLMEQSRRGHHNADHNEPFDDEVEKLLHSLEEDDSTIHTNTNANSPRVSKPASPTSQQLMVSQPASVHHLNEHDVAYRVNFTQNATSDNLTAAYQRKSSADIQDEPDAGQPLLKSNS